MTKSPHDLKVFVSSTSEDLEDYRAVARNVILDLHWRPEMMEHFDAQPGGTVDSCQAIIEQCDLVVLLAGWRQGWVPTVAQGGNGEDSITALELSHARKKEVPVLALLAGNSWPGNLWEDEAVPRKWVKKFREDLNQIAVFFEHEQPTTRESERLPRFRALLKQTLLAHKERTLARADDRDLPALNFFRSARDSLLDGSSVPVVGSGIYSKGPLSSRAMVAGLLRKSDGISEQLWKERVSVATAAEYRERLDGSRYHFLARMHSLLTEQATEAAHSPILDMLASTEQIRCVVSATYDRTLEDALDRMGRKYVMVSHVLRSCDGEKDGSLLVLRNGSDAEFCRADQLHVSPEECLVYKPQGSPFLHDRLDPELEIDTVVVTETDHALFLRRLESPETGPPAPLRKLFRRSTLLFLGYTMDDWQYRLMMMVFQTAGRQDRRATTLAVRVPETEIEEVAWNRLSANLIRMDPNQFARSAIARGQAAG